MVSIQAENLKESNHSSLDKQKWIRFGSVTFLTFDFYDTEILQTTIIHLNIRKMLPNKNRCVECYI